MVKITLEIRVGPLFETEMTLLSVDPPPDRLSEEFKEKIWEDWGIDVDLVDGGEDAHA